MSAVAPIFDAEAHSYTLQGKPLISVSRVIDAIMKKSFDGVDPAILANAAERGQRTEDYATQILETGRVEIPAGERQDVIERVRCFWKWYSHHKPKLIAKQVMVWSEEDGVAGKLDWIVEYSDGIYLVDCKVTSQAEKAWALQIGAYSQYYPKMLRGCAVLHINPSFAQGYLWREYDTQKVLMQWQRALNWYRTLEQLNAL